MQLNKTPHVPDYLEDADTAEGIPGMIGRGVGEVVRTTRDCLRNGPLVPTVQQKV